MKKLKIRLLYSVFIIFTFIYCWYVIYNKKINFKYPLDIKEIYGIIQDYKIDGNVLKLELINKNKWLCIYYINTLDEKQYFLSHLKLGLKIKLKGNIEEIKNNTNFNLFNYKKYLYSKKIYKYFLIDEIKIIKQENIFYKMKNKMKNISKNTYINLFLFGEKNLDDDIKDSFRLNGISHLFSISGMHIGLFTVFLLKILKKFSNKSKAIIIFSFLIFYMFLTNFSISVMRASFSFILLFLKKIWNLKISNLSILLLLTCAFLIYNPYYIYHSGFLFSFSISIILTLFSNKINQKKNYIIKSLYISFLSFCISIPILIYNSYEINLLTPIINLLYIPFVSFILFPLSLLTFIFPFLIPILNFFTYLLEISSIFISKITWFTIYLCKIPVLIVILYYLIIIYILYHLKYWFILLIIFLIHTNIRYFNRYFKITMLDVGQGDSILVDFPYNKGNILIDTGGIISYNIEDWKQKSKEYHLSDFITINYLKSIGIHKLDYLIITHGDYDHMGEAINLVNNFKVEKVIFNCGEYNELEKELIEVLENKKIEYYSCIKELNIDDYKLHFLNTGVYDNENDNSNVIYLEFNNYKFLFMGDAGLEKEKDVLEKYNLKDIDFLKVGHHGSNTSSSKYFIDSLNPKYSLISVGQNNRYDHPKTSVLNILSNSQIYRTDLDGSIEIKLNKNEYKIRTCNS